MTENNSFNWSWFLPQALPIVVFFSSVMSILYFLGLMQWVILKVWKDYVSTTMLITISLFIAYSRSGSMTKGHVFLYTQISWIMQITMGTSPTETLSVAGNIFVGQVLIMSLNTNKSENIFSQIPLHLILTAKGSLITSVINKNYSSCVCLHVQPVFCAADWGSSADPPIFEGHDQIWDPCRYDWRICHNCRQCHGSIHLIWGA